MGNKKRKQTEVELQLDPEELKAKQSVRTTFRLAEKTINLLKVAAKHLGIKQKTLLDQLLEDEKALAILAEDATAQSRAEHRCRPKTLVLSKKALDQIETAASRHEIPRDVLIELSVDRLASYIDALAQTHAKRRALMAELEHCQEQITEVLDRAGMMLPEDDAFRDKLKTLSEKTRKQVEEMRKTVKYKGEFAY